MKFRRFYSRVFRNAEPGDDGGGFADASAQEPSIDTGAAPADAGLDQAAAPQAPLTPEQRTAAMQDAMFGKPELDQSPEAVAQRARDAQGRFTNKQDQTQPAKPGDTLKPQPKQPGDPLTAMPEGLTPKAQERFQALANTNKELTARVQEAEPIVQSARELQATFQENGVKREQFDQAMQVVGLMNRGDLEGALRVLDEQRSLISMAMGKPLPGADPLSKFPDLRDRVDALQLTEADAIELARNRTVQHSQQQQRQRQEQEFNQQQQVQQATQGGQLAVDRFCKSKMTSDLDYARIEPLLLEQVQNGLLEGVPPQRWAAIVEKTYGLIKQTASMTRGTGSSGPVLRPTGGESPSARPKSMHEAMWGNKAPA